MLSLIYSIIIPVKKNVKGLETTLKSIISDKKLADFEIIVVNDANDKAVSSLIHNYRSEKIPIFEIKITDSKGAYFARNRAIEKSNAKFLIFFDDDMILPNNWFEKLNPYFDKYDYIAGKVQLQKAENESIFKTYFRLITFPFEDYFNNNNWGGTGFLIVKKEVFEKCGLFDEELLSGSDNEFGQRFKEFNFKSVFFDKYTAFHRSKSIKAHIKSVLRDTQGLNELSKKYPEKYLNKRVTLKSIISTKWSWIYHTFNYKNHKAYKSGEMGFFSFQIANTFYFMIHILARIIVILFPNKKFNY